MTHFIHTEKEKQSSMKGDIDDNAFTSYKRYKDFQEKVQAGLLIQS